jgi:hypothetical protein
VLWSGQVSLQVASEGGLTFSIWRRYAGDTQADAFQAVLDRLQALALINWKRTSSRILIVVAPDAARYLVSGP